MADGRHFEIRYIAISQWKINDFDEILYTAADFVLDERHVIKNEKVALDRLRVRHNIFLVFFAVLHYFFNNNPYYQCKETGDETSELCSETTWRF